MNRFMQELTKGLWKELPPFRLLLGLCPVLAVTKSASSGIGMGMAVLFVLTLSNMLISMVLNIIPSKVRIACFITISATLVVVVELLMQAYAYPLYLQLGIFVPLIVVNCIILGRAEAFASKNGPVRSILDGLGMGLGFTLALTMLGVIREFLTSGSVFEVKVITAWSTDFLLPSAAPGAFIIVGCILAAKNYCNRRKAIREGRLYVPPAGMDCHHCRICFTSKEGEE